VLLSLSFSFLAASLLYDTHLLAYRLVVFGVWMGVRKNGVRAGLVYCIFIPHLQLHGDEKGWIGRLVPQCPASERHLFLAHWRVSLPRGNQRDIP
jgi:hypothetical protein